LAQNLDKINENFVSINVESPFDFENECHAKAGGGSSGYGQSGTTQCCGEFPER